jgi:hypothetical protein
LWSLVSYFFLGAEKVLEHAEKNKKNAEKKERALEKVPTRPSHRSQQMQDIQQATKKGETVVVLETKYRFVNSTCAGV